MRYFRTYPWGLQIMLFLLMAMTFGYSAVAIVGSLLPKLTGLTLWQVTKITPASPAKVIDTSLTVEGISSVCVWMLTAFVFAYLAHPKPASYLGLRKPEKMIQPFLAIFIMLGAMPVLEALGGLISHINFGPAVKAEQQANDDTMSAFLNITSFAAFIKVFVILAIVPAMGEEMFFRGVFMRFVKKRTTGMAIPAIFIALIFALAHFNIYGFLSIFIAGILLAVIYNLTGSLWCSILAHLFFNGTQIIQSYAGNANPSIKIYLDNINNSYYTVAAGAVIFCVSFYLLLKNKTPLPPNWADDFTPAELQEERALNSK